MSRTLAVVIGVSHYASPQYPPLPGAAADARRVFSALRTWGLPPEDLRFLADKDATRADVLRALRVWPLQNANRDLRMIFYFAGHGALVEDPSRTAKSVILTHDVCPEDRASTGILMTELVEAIGRVQPREAYIFIDACHQRIDLLHNPFPLPTKEAVAGAASSARCFFCLVAAGTSRAFEYRQQKRGVFTTALLQNMAELRDSRGPVSRLANCVASDLMAKGFRRPEFYAIGTVDGWPLPAIPPLPQKPRGKEREVERSAAVALLTDSVTQANGAPVWFTGPSGAGKSVIARQFCRSVTATYLSLDTNATPNVQQVLSGLAGEVVENSPDLFPSARRPTGRPYEVLRTIARLRPGSSLVIDHLERLPQSQRARLAAILSTLSFDVIFVANVPAPQRINLHSVECPCLTDAEISAFRRMFARKGSMSSAALATLSDRFPLRLRALLTSGAASLAEITRESVPGVTSATAALSVTKGYVDETLFRRMTGVEVRALAWLNRIGLISFVRDHYQAHDQLIRRHAKPPAANLARVGRFLAAQALRWPQHLWANRALLEFVAREGYSRYLPHAVQAAAATLIKVNDWETVIRALDKVLITPLAAIQPALFIASEAAHIARHDVVDKVWSALHPIKKSTAAAIQLSLIRSERLFWEGDFAASARLAAATIARSQTWEHTAQAHLNSAIARFFQGRWTAALDELASIEQRRVPPRTRGWALLISGTVHGLRGGALRDGITALEKAIQILGSSGDDVGAAIAWNNLGEIRWKSRDFRSAVVCLNTAQALIQNRGDRATELEITRNLLHTHLRLDGPNSPTVYELKRKLAALLRQISDLTEHMQAWNTLATVALYQGNWKLAKSLIAKGRPYTKGNREYEIYTCANAAILQAVSSNLPRARAYLSRAFRLAESGCNYMALFQLKHDITAIEATATNSLVGRLLLGFHTLSSETQSKLQALEV